MYYFIILNWKSVFTTVALLEAEDITTYSAVVLIIAAVMLIKAKLELEELVLSF